MAQSAVRPRRPAPGGPPAPGPGPAVPVVRPGRLRTFGPLAALAVPATLLGIAALVLAAWPCEGTCVRPYGTAWLLVLIAVPTALAAGLPWFISPLNVGLALATSLAGWLAFGAWAGRRASEDLDAGWWAFWRELGFMVGGVVAGVLLGLAVMAAFLTYG